jgi:hypothetical protein
MDAKIEAAGYEARSYSGRGMYGAQCVGVDLDRGVSEFRLAIDLAVACVHDGESEQVAELGHLATSSDSMGLGSIVYFPSVKWEGVEEEDDLDDDDADGGDDLCEGCGASPNHEHTDSCSFRRAS